MGLLPGPESAQAQEGVKGDSPGDQAASEQGLPTGEQFAGNCWSKRREEEAGEKPGQAPDPAQER